MFEDLGIQQAPNSTLCSYLNKLLWILTGNFAKRGGQHLHSSLRATVRAPAAWAARRSPERRSSAAWSRATSVPQEILGDHPDRFRAMIVESSNPAHSIADSAACRAALRRAGTAGGGRRRDDRDRAAGALRTARGQRQFEKVEATFFNLEFPHNTFHLRHPLLDPLPGTLPEPEIWARLVRALGVVDDAELHPLRRAAAERGLRRRTRSAFFAAVGANPLAGQGAALRAVRDAGSHACPTGLAGAAALWGWRRRWR